MTVQTRAKAAAESVDGVPHLYPIHLSYKALAEGPRRQSSNARTSWDRSRCSKTSTTNAFWTSGSRLVASRSIARILSARCASSAIDDSPVFECTRSTYRLNAPQKLPIVRV
jgi:hypothetical protein